MVNGILDALGIDRGSEEPVCLDFANTVGERLSEEPDEYLKTPEALGKWLVKHRLLSEEVELDEEYLRRAIDLRDSIYRICSALASRREPHAADVDVLNGELAEALAKTELTDALGWSLATEQPIEKAFMILALSAAALFTSGDAGRIRECANRTCGWVFVDHSKNRSRRWCSMSDCGNVEKARRFQERRRGAGPASSQR